MQTSLKVAILADIWAVLDGVPSVHLQTGLEVVELQTVLPVADIQAYSGTVFLV